MRRINHPGASVTERRRVVPCRIEPLSLTLAEGISINAAVAAAFAGAGFDGGFVRLGNAPAAPLHYVIPAASPDENHAAWYSDRRSPEGVSTIEDIGMIAGRNDGKPFLHGHGIWRIVEGRRMGHILPLDSRLAEPVEAKAWAVSGGLFDVCQDNETNFRLFSAEASGSTGTGSHRGLLCILRPNEDIVTAVESICIAHRLHCAEIHGIGSLVGCDFEDGRHVPSYATEVLIRSGSFKLEGDRPTSALDVALVDMGGEIHEGLLARNRNPVCVTFELLIVEAGGQR